VSGAAPTSKRRAAGRGVWFAAILLLLALLAPARAQEAQIGVESAQLQLAGEGAEAGWRLDADFTLTLPPALEDALNRGIALYFSIDFEAYRERWYWFDSRVVDTRLSYRLTYSPLTRQYRLARGSLALPFDTLAEALSTMTRVRQWKVAEAGAFAAGAAYRARVRMRLDTAQLPRPFQIDALTNRDWALGSDWRAVAVPTER
jgi:hypothetical protein